MRMKVRRKFYLAVIISGLAFSFYILASTVSVRHKHQEGQEPIVPSVYEERQRAYLSVCNRRQPGHVGRLYLHNQTKLAYCPVPKIGCTFWKRVFLFLHKDTGNMTVDNPFQIPRYFVHFGQSKRTHISSWHKTSQNDLQKYNRFLFTRNPYSRLWSAYLDKFFLPDFWRIYGTKIPRTRASTSKCHNDISFREFLEYIVSVPARKLNDHWRPVKFRCDPCLFKPDIIGKQETFIDDTEYILKNTSLARVLSKFDYSSFVEEELITLTDYNFDLLKINFFKSCTNTLKIARLLLRVFQMNGYLPKHVHAEFVVQRLTQFKGFEKEAFKKIILQMYHSASEKDRKRWTLQKGEALRNAFSTIPESLIQSLIEVYKDDFEMFGYNTLPPGRTILKYRSFSN